MDVDKGVCQVFELITRCAINLLDDINTPTKPLTSPYVYGVNRRSVINNFDFCFRQEIPLFKIFMVNRLNPLS